MSESKSKRERQLEENYEEAAFELMMYRMMKSKGEELLEENRRLEEDPDFHVPEELDDKVIKLIDRKLAQKNRAVFLNSFGKVVSRVAVVFLVLAIMFAIPFSTARAFRTATLEYLIKIFDDSTHFQKKETTKIDETLGMKRYPLWLPDAKWELISLQNEEDIYSISLNSDNGICLMYEEIYSEVGVLYDTENADTRDDIVVQGFPAMSIAKDDMIIVFWTDETRDAFCTLTLCGNINQISLDTAVLIAEKIK
jgi:hypothetical protein